MPNPADASRWIYDGARLLGALKELASGGVEVFIVSPEGELVYLSKAIDLREAAAIVHTRRARLEGAPTEQAAE